MLSEGPLKQIFLIYIKLQNSYYLYTYTVLKLDGRIWVLFAIIN